MKSLHLQKICCCKSIAIQGKDSQYKFSGEIVWIWRTPQLTFKRDSSVIVVVFFFLFVFVQNGDPGVSTIWKQHANTCKKRCTVAEQAIVAHEEHHPSLVIYQIGSLDISVKLLNCWKFFPRSCERWGMPAFASLLTGLRWAQSSEKFSTHMVNTWLLSVIMATHADFSQGPHAEVSSHLLYLLHHNNFGLNIKLK